MKELKATPVETASPYRLQRAKMAAKNIYWRTCSRCKDVDRDSIAAALNAFAESEIESLESQLTQVRSERDNFERKSGVFWKELKAAELELNQVREELTSLNAELFEEKKQRSKAENLHEWANGEITRLRSELSMIDEALARRPALASIPDRYGKISLACSRAAHADISDLLRGQLELAKSSRLHTQDWYARHYGKLEDWARTELPEPYVHDFFCCIANGSSNIHDSNYFRMDTATKQLLQDQYMRAEAAELNLGKAQEQLEQAKQQTEKEWRICELVRTSLRAAEADIKRLELELGKAEAENKILTRGLLDFPKLHQKLVVQEDCSHEETQDILRAHVEEVLNSALHSSTSTPTGKDATNDATG